MGRIEKLAVFELIVCLLAGLTTGGIYVLTQNITLSFVGMGLLGLLGFSRFLFKEKGAPEFDERDLHISGKSVKAAFAVFWMIFIGCWLGYSISIAFKGSISLERVSIFVWFCIWMVFTVQGFSILYFSKNGEMGRIKKNILHVGMIGIVSMFVIAGPYYLNTPEVPEITGHQADIWTINKNGQVKAESKVSRIALPEDALAIEFKMPYKQAILNKILSAEHPLPFMKIKTGRYVVDLSSVGDAISEKTLDCSWTVPVEALKRDDTGYTIELQPFIGATSYRIDVALADDSGYKFSFAPEEKRITVFKTNTDFPKECFGICYEFIKPVSEGE